MGFTSLIGDHDHCANGALVTGTASLPAQLTGNTVSRRLKLLCNDTGSLFPTSTYRSVSNNQFVLGKEIHVE